MSNDGRKVVEFEIPATIQFGDGPPQKARLKYSSEEMRIAPRAPITVDVEKLRTKGELDEHQLDLLANYETSYGHADPKLLILATGGLRGVMIGILTNGVVYPKNIFHISVNTFMDCCTPTGEDPVEVKPYDPR